MSTTEPKKTKNNGNQGEGNREADRRYREDVKRFVKDGRVEPAADEAKKHVEKKTKR